MPRIRILFLLLFVTALPATAVELGEPYLVEDIDRTGEPFFEPCHLSVCPPPPPIYGALLEQMTPFGDRVMFVANDRIHGDEPWISDGTEEGTRLLADVCPGECSARIRIAGRLGDRMLFWADPEEEDGSGQEYSLWASDGTPEGTGRLDELCPLLCDVTLASTESIVFEGSLFFELYQGRTDVLWRTDGTPEGTGVVQFTCSGSGCYRRLRFFEYRGSLFFNARDHMQRLDRPDGETREVWAGDPTEAAALGDRLLLVWGSALFGMDGPRDTPERIIDFPGEVVRNLAVAGDMAYFSVSQTPYNARVASRLWRTDGTQAGTEAVTGMLDGGIDSIVGAEGKVLFVGATDPEIPAVLWHVNPEGRARILLDQPIGTAQVVADRLLFSSTDPAHGEELWVSDGTVEGTRLVEDIAPGHASSRPGDGGRERAGLVEAGDRIYFPARHPETDTELWAAPLLFEEEPPSTPPPPGDEWLTSGELSGFRVQVRITAPAGEPILGRHEANCIPETLCVSGAVEGRSEVFVRVPGPKPNGLLWPTLVKFSTSTVEVWLEQIATGELRYYRLEGARPGHDELPGLFDRTGFEPVG